ncbi:MAG: NAD-dependent epimerase/dehydratase family protein [Janthinobacterium lividum]
MRIVVTGGLGFIGSPVTTTLRDGGHEIVVLDAARSTGLANTTGGITVVRGDIRDLDRVRGCLEGADAVVHLAAKVGLGVGISDIDDYVAVNDLGTAVVLRAAADAGVRRLVLASSMVVYGEGAYDCPRHGRVRPAPRREEDLRSGRFEPSCPSCGTELLPGLVAEDDALDPRNVYAATKLHGEHLSASWARESGGRAVALRFHNVYGPGLPVATPYAGVAALFRTELLAHRAPKVFEDGGQRRDFVAVSDVARAVATAVERLPVADGGFRAYNVGSGRVCTVGEVATLLARATGGPEPEVTGAFRLGDVRHVTASSARASAELGWSARIRLEDGLTDLAAEAA